jgi:dihydroorotate dehydrogenase electron transfer subunit
MPTLYHCPITSTQKLSNTVYKIFLHCPQIAAEAKPGHFINIKISDSFEPLWRRPFSIHSVDRDAGLISVLFEVVGRGTAALAEIKKGEALNVLGTLGKCFREIEKDTQAILVAGGLGVAPIYFQAEELLGRGQQPLVLIGARSEGDLYCVEELEKRSIEVQVSTEDGSIGFKGLITGLLERILKEHKEDSAQFVFSCGPMPMLAAVSDMCQRFGIPGQVSLETLMACGFGACQGCVVPARGDSEDYLLACKDGPVFDFSEVDLGS